MNFRIFYNLGALLHQCVTLMKRITSHHCIFTLVLWMHLFVGTRRLCNLCSNEYWLSNKHVIILSQHGPWRQAKQLPTHLISPGAPPNNLIANMIAFEPKQMWASLTLIEQEHHCWHYESCVKLKLKGIFEM